MKIQLKLLLSFLFLLTTGTSWALTKGYNQAWLKNAFAHQWLDQAYDEKYAKEIIRLNKEGGSELLRMWLYEGSGLTQFNYNQNAGTIKLKPEVLKNLTNFLKLARKHNLKINLTFLDGNAYKNLAEKPHLNHFWWNVFNNKYGKGDHFYQEAIAPIYQLVTQFKDVVTQIDLVNEVNAIKKFNLFETPKDSMSAFLCKLGQNRPTKITASLGWADAETNFFKGLLNSSCLDFYDIHLYNDLGIITRCQDFKRLAQKGYHFQLGEFGQISKSFNDDLQAILTQRFLESAENCGFRSALAWRLEDSRNGYNAEARHSYLAFGSPRKAYYVLRDF